MGITLSKVTVYCFHFISTADHYLENHIYPVVLFREINIPMLEVPTCLSAVFFVFFPKSFYQELFFQKDAKMVIRRKEYEP